MSGPFIDAIQKMDEPQTRPDGQGPPASFYRLRAQLLEQGRTNTFMAKTKNMWATLKVYASGGENTLHAHPHEDHTFLVMQGRAVFFGPDGQGNEIGPLEGIMLPAGSLYHFHAIEGEPLVLFRVGCRSDDADVAGRTNINGAAAPSDAKENGREPVIYKKDAYFG
jgi:mannose-6-phosphate isomerase-like protein (cupin superfamily)